MDLTVQKDTEYIQLDSWNNNIIGVNLFPPGSAMYATLNGGNVPVNNEPLTWMLKYPNPQIGEVLVVQLPLTYGAGEQVSIQVYYSTQPGGNAGANFLSANQTSYGEHPFFFTYSMDITGRMWAPQMDTPANRITWGGCVTTNDYLQAYMSANQTGVYASIYGYYKTCFYNQVPTANYLMATVVGYLVEGEIYDPEAFGRPCWVIAEPNVLASALSEFSYLQIFEATTEAWVQTPYIWGPNYRVIVMPPVYPMGGMANPLLAYTSQTTIVGDKSQMFVLVRNIAQMWTGAQVTPSNWEDTWINEGFTTYIERNVLGQLDGLSYSVVESYVGNNSASMGSVLGMPNKTYHTLHPVLHGANPNLAFSNIAFEKGFQFLWWIATQVLGESPYNQGTIQDFVTYFINTRNL